MALDFSEIIILRDLIIRQMHEATEIIRTSCPDEPELVYRGSDGAESEGVDHSSNSLRANITDRSAKKIRACLAALNRIDNGDDYGVCLNDDCGEDIPFSRLQLEPTTFLCKDCKEALDSGRKTQLTHSGPRRGVSYVLKSHQE